MISFDTTRSDFAPYGFTCEVWTPVPMRRADRHNEIELNLLRDGELYYLLGGQQITVKAGQLAIFWAAIRHEIIGFSSTAEYYVATIPLAWFLQCRFPQPFNHDILHGRVLSNPQVETGDIHLFSRWVEDLQDPDPARRRLVFLEMEARLLRLALSVTAPVLRKTVQHGKNGGQQQIETIARFIAEHYTEKLDIEKICRHTKLHPNYAMSLFKQAFGMSMVDYVTQYRISHAQRLLATSEAKILEVALSSGFNSLSRFNEVFKQYCTCSPREYRKRHWCL